MTTQKAQSKIKSSTVAITVLSILLAIAVVSTIVLAAFTASRTSTTTITFGNGLAIQITSDEAGITDEDSAKPTGAFSIEKTGLSGDVSIGQVKINPNQTADIAFGIKGGAASGFTVANPVANQVAHTVTYDINNGSSVKVATLTITVGSTFTLATITETPSATVDFVAYAEDVTSQEQEANFIDMITSITIVAVDANSANQLAGLEINSLITGIGAVTPDAENGVQDAMAIFATTISAYDDVE